METNQKQVKKVVYCKVYIAMPNNWKNRGNAMKRALGAIQRANMNLAILGVDNPADAHAHYFIDTRQERWTLRKHKQLQLQEMETIPLNQGQDTSLDFVQQHQQAAAASPQQQLPVQLPYPPAHTVLDSKLA